MNNIDNPKSEAEGLFEAYKDFSTVLRTWLVAYGIGGPVIILSQEHIWKALGTSAAAACAGVLFLSGVIVQVFFAAFFKWAMWELWFGLNDEPRQKRKRYRFAKWASENYWIDVVTDFGSLATFAIATVLVATGLL